MAAKFGLLGAPESEREMMSGDFRETIVGCGATFCRFNVKTSIEGTCSLKMVVIGDTGRCLMAEGRPVHSEGSAPMQKVPGHYEGGKWVE